MPPSQIRKSRSGSSEKLENHKRKSTQVGHLEQRLRTIKVNRKPLPVHRSEARARRRPNHKAKINPTAYIMPYQRTSKGPMLRAMGSICGASQYSCAFMCSPSCATVGAIVSLNKNFALDLCVHMHVIFCVREACAFALTH